MATSDEEKPCFFLQSVDDPEALGSYLAVHILTCVLNSILSVTATAGNAFVLLLMWKTPSLHTPANLLLCSLASADFVIGLITQPSFITYKIAEMHENAVAVACHGRVVHWVTGFLCAGVSLITITAISIDKLLALVLHLRYISIVTIPRVRNFVVICWTFCVLTMVLLFIVNADRYWSLVPAPVVLVSLTTTVLAYVKIFGILRRHRNQIHDQSTLSNRNLRSGLTIKKFRKSAMTTLYILILFLACYLPFLVAMLCRIITGYTASIKVAYEICATVVYVNSTLNPVLYCLRITEVRAAALRKLRRWRVRLNFFLAPGATRSSGWTTSAASTFGADLDSFYRGHDISAATMNDYQQKSRMSVLFHATETSTPHSGPHLDAFQRMAVQREVVIDTK